MIRIARLELFETKLPLVAPFETSFGKVDHREPVIVRLEDADGAVGWGESPVAYRPHFNAETNITAWHVIADFVPALLRGRSFESAEQLAAALAPIRGHNMAKAAVEFAFCDLLAKKKGVPIAAIFGATPRPIEVGVSVGIQPSVDALLDRVAKHLEEGYLRVKLKIAPGWDTEPVQAVRERFPEVKLMADANGAYTLDHRLILEELEPFDLMVLEQPLQHEDLVDHRELAKALRTPIALDESLPTLGTVRAALELGACAVVNVKPGRLGGPTAARAALEATKHAEKGAFLGGMLESGIGRAANLALAALEGFTIEPDLSASDRYYKEDIVDPPFVLDKETGCIPPTTGPGIGVRVLEDVLARRSVRRQSFTV